ncbi:MAG: hypothetical protein E6I91_07870 [Chloroflexi bacterium]|nr:MAG: hypothetical protein E6I91_07870 [Chloroflexota bacterium]
MKTLLVLDDPHAASYALLCRGIFGVSWDPALASQVWESLRWQRANANDRLLKAACTDALRFFAAPVIGRRWTKKCVEVYEDLRGEFGGAGGVVDSRPGLVAHDERIGCQGFGTVRTPFRQTRNPCALALFVVDDEHDGLPFVETTSRLSLQGIIA